MAASPEVPPTPSGRRRRPVLALTLTLALALVVGALGASGVAWLLRNPGTPPDGAPPTRGTTVQAARESKAATAAARGDLAADAQRAADYLSDQPTAYWLTPEEAPLATVAATVQNLSDQAREQDASLAVVVYGLPERDCADRHSTGGADDGLYGQWVREIGRALSGERDQQKIVVLEPDSLALAPECGNVAERVRQLQQAVDVIAGPNTWIYLDGGHSRWLPATDMANLIAAIGRTDAVRGFSTNVSNYNSTAEEVMYAHEVAAALGRGHAIIDTSRNGAGPWGDVWCNPPGRLIGDRGGTIGDDIVDTNLWIKPPGESDGACGGGPPAGDWWPEASVVLTRAAFGVANGASGPPGPTQLWNNMQAQTSRRGRDQMCRAEARKR